MVIVDSAPNGAECAFSHTTDVLSGNGRPAAVATVVFEFRNGPDRYFCADHAERIRRMSESHGSRQ